MLVSEFPAQQSARVVRNPAQPLFHGLLVLFRPGFLQAQLLRGRLALIAVGLLLRFDALCVLFAFLFLLLRGLAFLLLVAGLGFTLVALLVLLLLLLFLFRRPFLL